MNQAKPASNWILCASKNSTPLEGCCFCLCTYLADSVFSFSHATVSRTVSFKSRLRIDPILIVNESDLPRYGAALGEFPHVYGDFEEIFRFGAGKRLENSLHLPTCKIWQTVLESVA